MSPKVMPDLLKPVPIPIDGVDVYMFPTATVEFWQGKYKQAEQAVTELSKEKNRCALDKITELFQTGDFESFRMDKEGEGIRIFASSAKGNVTNEFIDLSEKQWTPEAFTAGQQQLLAGLHNTRPQTTDVDMTVIPDTTERDTDGRVCPDCSITYMQYCLKTNAREAHWVCPDCRIIVIC